MREPIAGIQLSNAHRPGLIAAFKVLAKRVAADGVTINTVLPGRIATERSYSTAGSREAAEAAARESVPAGRLGTRRGDGGRRGLPLLGAARATSPARRCWSTAALTASV